MEDDRSIDLKQHTLPKVSRWYMLRIIFYVVMLGVIGGVWYYMSHREKPVKDGEKIEEINGVTIDLDED
ncbi:MAG: hypothetical protein ACI865_002400 [Flavobacteriaceae bacterium]|jgi:hypothetical protein